MSLYLCLKTNSAQAEISIFDEYKKLHHSSWQADRQLAETLHLKIQESLNEIKSTYKNLNGLIVFRGPGSFTGLRIGVSSANGLAEGLGVPIIGEDGLNWRTKAIKRLSVGQNDKIVLPIYDSLPKTTQPKK